MAITRVKLRAQPDLQYHDISRQLHPLTRQVIYQDLELKRAEVETVDDNGNVVATQEASSGDYTYTLGTRPGLNNFGGPNPGSSLSPDPNTYNRNVIPGLAFVPQPEDGRPPMLVQPNVPDVIRKDDPPVPVVGRGMGPAGATLYYSVIDDNTNEVMDTVSFTISLNDPVPEVVVEQGDIAMMVGCGVQEQLSRGPVLTGVRYEYMASVLPNGVSINRDTGVLTGEPTEAGTFPITYSISAHNDGTGVCKITVLNFEITVLPGDVLAVDDYPYIDSRDVEATDTGLTLRFLAVPGVDRYKYRYRVNASGQSTGSPANETPVGYGDMTPEQHYRNTVGDSSLAEFLRSVQNSTNEGNELTQQRLGGEINPHNRSRRPMNGRDRCADYSIWSEPVITDPDNHCVQEIVVENLEPNTQYEIQVASVTSTSNSSYSTLFARTLQSQTLSDDDYNDRSAALTYSDSMGVPSVIAAIPFEDGKRARIEWTEVDNADSYLFLYSDNADELQNAQIMGTPNVRVVLTGLTEGTTYYFAVQAANDGVIGRFSETVTFQTNTVNVPVKQFGLTYRGKTNADSAYVTWRDPDLNIDYVPPGNYSPATDYLVSYRKVGDAEYKELTTTFQGAVLSSLEDGERYEVYVTAHNNESEVNNGYGVLSDILEFVFVEV